MNRPADLLLDKARKLVESWSIDQPVFDLKIGWCRSYDELFESELTEGDESELLGLAIRSGRVIISGRGGSGKTQLLMRLCRKAVDEKVLPVYINLKRWSGAHYEEWKQWTSEDPRNGTDFLLRRFGSLSAGALELDQLPPNSPKLVIVDGLNEMAATVGNQILVLLDDLVRTQMSASVIVADRLFRRELPNAARWRIGTTLPLAESEVRKQLGKQINVGPRDTLTSPFFLNAELERNAQGGNNGRAAELKILLQGHSALTEPELDEASTAAFNMYVQRHSRSRVFPTAEFAALTTSATVSKLVTSGVLVTTGADSYFDHHLVHDYLASRQLAMLGADQWQPPVFRAVTFEGSSFDALELAFEQLDVELGARFLRALYDWHLYAAGYVLGYAGDAGVAVSHEMRTVICAMLAEKQFDAVLASRERALDALRLIRTSEAQAFRDTKSIQDICKLISNVANPSAWFDEWRRVYCVSDVKEFTPEILETIREPDSVIGWTVANVARRFPGLRWAVPTLEGILKAEGNATLRWRAAHALGKVFSEGTAQVLAAAVQDDPDIDVKFGALRSLIEIALVTDSESRKLVKADLDRLATTISEHSRLSRELRSCLIMDEAVVPKDWLGFVRGCVRAQFVLADKVEDQDIWRGCLIDAEDRYHL